MAGQTMLHETFQAKNRYRGKATTTESPMVFEPRWDKLSRTKTQRRAAGLRGNAPADESSEIERGGIALAYELRARGLTIQQIVTLLNARKVPRRDGKPWTKDSVTTAVQRGQKSTDQAGTP